MPFDSATGRTRTTKPVVPTFERALLRRLAARKGEDQNAALRERLRGLPTLDFVPAVTTEYERPEHLSRVAEAFERIRRGEVVNLCFSVPPQHGKSILVLHGCVQLLSEEPTATIGYITYGGAFSHRQSKIAQQIATRAGLKWSGALEHWTTSGGGFFHATGMDGEITGTGVSRLLVIDDPHKNREEAESPVYRDRVFDGLGTLLPRIHPTTSIIVLHTRWHEDDLIGRLERLRRADGDRAWLFINLPAIADGTDPTREKGTALWHRRPVEFLQHLRDTGLSDYDFESQYLGRPRPRGAQVFKTSDALPGRYSALPSVYRVGKGIDLAYTAKSRADHSVGLVLLRAGKFYYVVDVVRRQLELNDFIPMLLAQSRIFEGTYRFYASSTERGIAHFSRLLPEGSIKIHAELAITDKFVHSQRAATEWNAGRILIPDAQAQAELQSLGLDTSWVEPFLSEMERFTGVGDREDDQCDGLFNALDTFPKVDPGDEPAAAPQIHTFTSALSL